MQILTRKNYDFYECSSSLQKEIRRGNEKKALFFGIELFSSGYGKYLWKRLLVISSEDIGLADNNIPTQINSLYNNYKIVQELGDTHGSEVIIIQAIMILSRSKKSRICDHAKVYALVTDDNFEIPDYALDNHTRRGKIKGRKFDFFIEEGARLENETPIEDEYKETFVNYLMDLQNKTLVENGHFGYDKRNVTHKNPKAMEEWKRNNNQTTMDL